jgi:hypothetical protein
MTAEPQPTHQSGDAGSFVDDVFWKRHANPRSVWAFIATYPVLVLAVYFRSRPLLAAMFLSILANLTLVSPPETDDAWATRVVLGEQVWLERGLLSQKTTFGLTAIGAMVNLYTLRAAVHRRPGQTVVGTVASMLLMFLFFHRMVSLYETYGVVDFRHDTPNSVRKS